MTISSGVISGLIWAAVILALWFIGSLLSRRRQTSVNDRIDLPYAAFTTDFDLVLSSGAVPAQLAADGVEGEVPRGSTMEDIGDRVIRFEAAAVEAAARLADADGRLDGQAICFLLDLSGSMAERLPVILGELRAIHSWAADHGASCAALGFTTRGWKGGLARQKWQQEGSPSYPGRLCALMHVEIAPFGRDVAAEDWRILLRPDVLRENVDGEAIRWASNLLNRVPAERRRLFVLSDGAPVDDSTLAENGHNYLMRDLAAAIGEVEEAGQIDLVGVGLCHHVDALYRTSTYLGDEAALAVLLQILLSDVSDKRGKDLEG